MTPETVKTLMKVKTPWPGAIVDMEPSFHGLALRPRVTAGGAGCVLAHYLDIDRFIYRSL
jgi:hypothetical protein